MRRLSRVAPFGILADVSVLLVLSAAVVGAQAPAPPGHHDSALTPETVERFLLNADIGARRGAGGGVTESVRATLSDGSLTHDAQIQTVDVAKDRFEAGKASEVGFRDSYRYNIAAY